MFAHSRSTFARRLVVGAMVIASQSGCVGFFRGTARSFSLAPNGLSTADDGFRRTLVTGGYQSAFTRAATVKDGAPDDKLLRALYRGLTGYYAGEFDASATAFAEADQLAEARETKSLSRGALSLVTSDRVLSYLPSRTERLFTRYYGMLSYLRANDVTGATVEARRLGALLEQAADDLSSEERATHALLRDVAGAVFESAGEWNDAAVSYRNAAKLRGATAQEIDSIRITAPSADSAVLVVVVESGFVAHRVDRGLTISLGTAKDSVRDTAQLVTRLVSALDSLPDGGVFETGWDNDRSHYSRHEPLHIGRGDGGAFLRIAWPMLVRQRARSVGAALALDSVRTWSAPSGVDVSDAVAADFRRARVGMAARQITRSLAKGAIVDAMNDKHGKWAGVFTSFAASALERADTRSWQLLPGRLSIVRVTVAAGEAVPELRVGDGGETMRVDIPVLPLSARSVNVTSARIWR